MKVTTDPNNPWINCKVYKLRNETEIAVVRGDADSPVRFYTEIHRYDRYVASYGSNARFAFLAVLQAAMHDCPKEELGYTCRHKPGECGEMTVDDQEDE